MLVAGFFFGCMGVFVKLGAEYFSHIELVFYRSSLGLLMIYAVIRQQGLSLSTPYLKQHLWRGVSGTIALVLYFYCITVLPLATAVTLNYTAPLYFSILTMLAFKEHFRPAFSSAILLGFCGVILLLHPTLARDQLIPGLIGLISGLLAGIAYLNVKQLGLRGEPEWRVVFYFSLIAAISSGGGMLLGTIHPITTPGIFILLGLSSTATLAQLAMTRAYHTGKMLVAGSLSYSTVIFASIFGMVLWGEALPLMGWIGMGLIIAGGVLSLKLAPKHGGA